MEAQPRHFSHACGQGNKCPDYRKQSSDQNRDGAKALEESLRQVELMSTKENVASISFNQRPSAIMSNLIGDDRAKVAADRPRRRREQKAKLAAVNQDIRQTA